MQKEDCNKLLVVGIFAAAMAFLETVIVVYLRMIFYPGGFDFPLKGFPNTFVLNMEWVREIATIVMLVCIAILAAKKTYERLAYFLFAFAVWDIFYYIWLKVMLGWPASLITWDLLFLIPWPWTSPVLAPLIISVTMIALGFVILNAGNHFKADYREWLFLIFGSLIVLYTFLYDYGRILISGGFIKDILNLASNQGFVLAISEYAPIYYNWPLFAFGEGILIAGIILLYLKNKRR